MNPLKSRRPRLVIGWLLVGSVIFLSLSPMTPHPARIMNDKFGHVFAYLVLMTWFAVIYVKNRARIILAAGFIFMGAALEFIQPILGSREFEYADMLANGIGVVLGWLSARALSKLSPPI